MRKTNNRLAAPDKLKLKKNVFAPRHSGYNLCGLCVLCGDIFISIADKLPFNHRSPDMTFSAHDRPLLFDLMAAFAV